MTTAAPRHRGPTGPAPGGRTRPASCTDEPSRADRNFNRITLVAGLSVLVLLTLVGVFLLLQSRTAIAESGSWQFLTRVEWRTDVHPARIGVLGLLLGTVLVALVAVAIALPLSVLTALAITEYAGARARKWLIGIVDLLAAVPSLLFGIWGFLFLSAKIVPLSKLLTDHLGWIPIFKTDPGRQPDRLDLHRRHRGVAMVLPIITSVVREVFSQAPPGEKEAALALGGTRWGMIRTVVLPYGRSGIVGGTDARPGPGPGRDHRRGAAVAPGPVGVGPDPAERRRPPCRASSPTGPAPTASPSSGLMAAGLVLFVITLATNMVASVVVSRSRSGVGVEL